MGRELTGALAIGPDIAPVLVEGGSSKQVVTEQREELCQALLPHPDQMARPVIAYGQFDKISTAWKLSLPGLTTDLTFSLQGGGGHAPSLAEHCLQGGGGKAIWGRD